MNYKQNVTTGAFDIGVGWFTKEIDIGLKKITGAAFFETAPV
ncbi:hypothetical protein [Sphingobacterium multivorum]|nr:hypothetical protein [Sphingobacterium multivorum]